jgi:phosphatidylglycerol:prolipoprotein diacylglycerol transferase
MTPFLAHWVHDLSPFLIEFGDSGFGIRYYGLAYLAGFAAAWWLIRRQAQLGRTPLSVERVGDLLTALVIGVLVGGRLGYFLFYQPESLLSEPLSLLRVWAGGMASHGGFLGVAAALWWCGRAFRVDWRHLGDLVVCAAPAGLFFGRVANFINGELWGKVSHAPWAMIFPASAEPGTPVGLIAPRHPSQLYAAALEGLLVLALLQYLAARTDWLQRAPGRLSGVFLIAYAVARAISEIFREPDLGVTPILGLSRGTFYSIFLVLGGLALLLAPSRPLTPAAPKS